ncbi:hypothetical protein AWENTII_004432 [Aspergillus wentii]
MNMTNDSPAGNNRHAPCTPQLDSAGRRKRTRTGCLNCSRRRRKCDEAKPTCTGCKRRGEQCQSRQLGSFRDSNMKVLGPEHPSMNQSVPSAKGKRQSKFKIFSVVPASSPRKPGELSKRRVESEERDIQASPPAEIQSNRDGNLQNGDSPATPPATEHHSQSGVSPRDTSQVPDFNACPSPNQRPSPSLSSAASFSHVSAAGFDDFSIQVNQNQSPNHGNGNDKVPSPTHYTPPQCDFHRDEPPTSQSYMHSSPEFVVDELTALRNLSNGGAFNSSTNEPFQTIPPPLFDHSVFSDPANFTNDVFLPGSAYEALHTALRNRQLWTARSDVPTRRSSPESVPGFRPFAADDRRSSRSTNAQRPRSRTGRCFELSPEREKVLWQNYLNEICVWLDMFDNHRHFASTFPQMAKSSPHLRYSILALSARQIERSQNKKSQSESLSLYQEAIHLLLPELESKTTPVIASCVILCVLEMLSCNPKEWRRHLDGCAYLIQAAEINGFSGKEEQALFWCFARMDVCGGLISEEETIIPIRNWIPKDMGASEASQLFLASKENFDTYANYTVYLCAQTLGVLFGCASKITRPCVSCQYLGGEEEGDSYVHCWKGLFDRVEQWYENRPCQMKSIFSVPTTGWKGREMPFPTVIYPNGAAISGNQLYHTCSLLLLQRRPKTLCLSRRPKSVLWHARQICAISASNAHHGCWTNALQPLWLAGKVMSHYSEHAAIVETLTRIERETGWATAWRVEDLKEFWGDEDEEYGDMDVSMSVGTPSIDTDRSNIHPNR